MRNLRTVLISFVSIPLSLVAAVSVLSALGYTIKVLTLLAPGGTRIVRVRAATEMRCLAVPRDDAVELIESEPSVALVMLREIARRFASALPDD